MPDKTTYLTTTIPFVNARPHVGFALELVQTDTLARYHRLLGGRVRLQTGTDEHAFKNVVAARQRGVSTEKSVTEHALLFRRLSDALHVSYDRFLRTTEPAHRAGVTAFWSRLRSDDIYRKRYTGRYCVGCEDFLVEKDLVDGLCPDHAARPEPVEEDNYFFRLQRYQPVLEERLASGRLDVVPESRRNEVLQFVRSGLRDFSVSRAAHRAGGWGIAVPGDESQVIYVWIDALINYLSGLGFGNGGAWEEVWNERSTKIHVIGKNVWKFHAVYWPALLLSAGLPLPNTVVVHGFLTHEGRKISKSLGNAIDPTVYVDELGSDAVRYYLLRNVPPFADGDFSPDRLRSAYDDLANGVGNLLSRLAALCERSAFGGFDPPAAPDAPEHFHDALRRYAFDTALETLWQRVRAVNREIEQRAPWDLLRQGNTATVREWLSGWLEALYTVGYWLGPFLPEASETIRTVLGRTPVRKPPPLFPRRTANRS